MSELALKILSILESKDPGEKVYLRGREELQDYPKNEILNQAEQMAEEGYLKLNYVDGFIELDNNMVNYYFDITDFGRRVLQQEMRMAN